MSNSDEGNRAAPDVAFEFEHDATAPSEARRALRPLFAPKDPLVEDVVLVASELVSNVIEHTEDGGYLRAWDVSPLRIEVHDADPSLPATVPNPDDRSGRGLRIVEQVADKWGAHLDASGKTMWAEFRRRAG